jgi:GT2 family glycosyltransferase
MQHPAVRLVVLNYNGGALVQRCVAHLEQLDWPRERLDLVVVDNDSSDGSDRELEQRFPKVRLVRSGANLGFPANNLALRDLDGVDYVGLVNNDAFVEPGWLSALVDVLEADPKVGAACPKIVLATRFVELRVQSSTWRPPGDGRDLGVRISGLRAGGDDLFGEAGLGEGSWALEPGPPPEGPFRWLSGEATVRIPVAVDAAPPPSVEVRLAAASATRAVLSGGGEPVEVEVTGEPQWFTVPLGGEPHDVINNVGSVLVAGGWGADRGFLERDRGQYEEAQDVFAWCGAGVLFRPAMLADVGLFDERFFMYYEDTDLSWRGRARGWRFRYTPAAVMRHVHAATSVEGSAMFQHHVERNRLLMLLKNAPRRMVLDALVGFVTATGSYALRDVVRPVLRGKRPRFGLVRARLGSLLGVVRLAPAMLADRRRLRARQTVPDRAITGWAVHR